MTLLVTGIGRSGTAYTARVLNECGVMCGHERVWQTSMLDGVTEWGDPAYAAEASWPAAAHLGGMCGSIVAVHQVRHPILWARSWLLAEQPVVEEGRLVTLQFVDRHSGFDYSAARLVDPLAAVMRLWVSWNALVEAHAKRRIQVESITASVLQELGRLASVDVSDDVAAAALARVPRDTNTRGPTDQTVTWGTLRGRPWFDEYAQMALRYGYEVDT